MNFRNTHDNYKKLINQLSKDLNLDVKIIDDILKHTGRWLHNSCEQFESKTYLWRKFGSFKLKQSQLTKLNENKNEQSK